MALVITVAADIEPQAQIPAEKQTDLMSSAPHSLTMSDYGSYSSELSFAYPGEFLSDDEFTEEFSSSCDSSRRSSKDVPRVSSASLLQCAAASPGSGFIPLPPPPPSLPSDRNMISIIRIPSAPTPPPLPTNIFPRSTSLLSFDISPFSSYPDEDLYMTDDDDDYERWCRAECSSQPSVECIVCCSKVESLTNMRKCCSQVICKSCIKEIVRTNIEDEGIKHILCPNPECQNGVITMDEILSSVSGRTKEHFHKLRLQESEDSTRKTCPNCCLLTEHKVPGRFRRYKAENVMITCSKCQFVWCFRCHAPWHSSITCKQLQRGDKPFKKWTKSKTRGTANCQKCPLCRVHIQRSTGCDHMTCNRCETEFCYQCGGMFTEFPGLGNHYTSTSVFGCANIYKRDQPIQRKAVRGSYLAAKLAMLTGYPVLFVAGVAVVILVGAVALPIYGGYRYYKFKKRTNQMYRPRH